MPFGLQMIGPLQGDVRLLSSARAFEAAWRDDTGLARPRPALSLLQVARPALKSIVTHPPGRPADD
jgi:hypothetical protein